MKENETIKIIALGGLDEEGKNCTLVEIDKDIFVVEAGVKYPDRTMPGIDFIIPQFDYLEKNKDRVKAYIILHGHDDEMGALAYFYAKVPAPIYGSNVTCQRISSFAKHARQDVKFDFHEILPTCSIKIAGRKFSFFHTAHNVAQSSGVAIATSQGNIVFTSDFVVENNAYPAYLHDMKAIASLSDEPTLALLSESVYADREGYTAPRYKLTPLIDETIKSAEGRVFISVFATNNYNIDEIVKLAIANRRKIICYDEETLSIIKSMQTVGELVIPRENFASIDDILRLKDTDILVVISGYSTPLYNKIALLADKQAEDTRVVIKTTDTFIVASPANSNTELEATDAIDALYKTDCHVKNISRKNFLNMHASKEDLKMMISLFRPKYYLPISGLFKDQLNNAQTALSMGINLNHRNVFILSNGITLIIDEKGARMFDEKIPHGDLMIDGIGVGDTSDQVIEDRRKLAEGVVVLALSVSKKKRCIVAGPDVQMRGFVFVKDADAVLRDVTKILVSTVNEFLAKAYLNMEEMKQNVYEKCLRVIRYQTGREPMVLPLIVEVD